MRNEIYWPANSTYLGATPEYLSRAYLHQNIYLAPTYTRIFISGLSTRGYISRTYISRDYTRIFISRLPAPEYLSRAYLHGDTYLGPTYLAPTHTE